MGLLDDAIRDHLDLKRRRGADPAEVERAEREALGPVRRNPSPSDLAEEDAAALEGAVPDGGVAYDQAGEEDWVHDSVQDPPAPAPAPPPFQDVHDPLDAEDDLFEDEPGPAPEPVAPAPPSAMGHAGPATAE